ncbi:MAG: Ig-like domain-containing protein [Bacteroidales bacterium]|jgi:hypothetical protein|nr:Ig-like domain-containing protein [Bacteroidales bacterium]
MLGTYTTDATISCDAYDCNGVQNGNAYINDCGDCVEGYVPCAENTPPDVNITNPPASATFADGDNITIQVNATDSDGAVVKVEFYSGTTKLGESVSSPYSFSWTNVQAGTYVLTAVVTDDDGLSTTSEGVSVSVLNIDCNGVAGGTAYIDNCGDCVGGNTGLQACPQIKAQAEDVSCSFDGVIDNNNAGFEGSGFINGDNAAQTMVTFTIDAQESGSVVFGIQYANGGTADRPCQILVNGVEEIASFSMPVTAWTDYQNVETNISLQTGMNEITLVALSANGFASLDFYYLYGNVSFGECDVTQIITLSQGWNLFSTHIYSADSSVENLFSGLDVKEIKTEDNFWVASLPAQLNGISHIEAGKGYLVYMNSAGTLSLTGTVINNPVVEELQQGWNIVGVPVQTEIAFSSLFDETNCQRIKNFDGFWQPDGGTYTIQNLQPDTAYFMLQ